MARGPTSMPPAEPNLSPGQIRRCIEKFERCISELEEFDLSQLQKRGDPSVSVLEASIEVALSTAFGHKTPSYNRYRRAATLDHGTYEMRSTSFFGRGPAVGYTAQDAMVARQCVAEGKAESIAMLRQAIRQLEDQLADQEAAATEVTAVSDAAPRDQGSKVFIVHGHDEAALLGLARFLEQIQLKAIVLSELPNQGRSIIEKFEDSANEVGFAVVLLTPDDMGASVSADEQNRRARQNVIFELGYFAGKLGRGKVCLLRKGEVEIPSDLHGVIYTNMDAYGAWKIGLVKELKAAGLEFDANRAFEN